MSTSHSLRSPDVQPVANIWPHGEKQQATTLASLTALHLRRTHQRDGSQPGTFILASQLALWVSNECNGIKTPV